MPITNNHFNCSLKSEIRSHSDPAFPAIMRVDEQRDSYFTKFETSNFACPQVMLLGSLVSEQLLFLLYNLSFPCGYFWSATSSFTLKLQWGRLMQQLSLGIVSQLSQSYLKLVPNLFKSCLKFVSKLSQGCLKVVPKCFF